MPHPAARPSKRKKKTQEAPLPAFPQAVFALLFEHVDSRATACALALTCRSARLAFVRSPWGRLVPAAVALRPYCSANWQGPSVFAGEIEQLDSIRALATRATVRERNSEALLRMVPRMRIAICNSFAMPFGLVVQLGCCLMIPGPACDSPHIFESLLCKGDGLDRWWAVASAAEEEEAEELVSSVAKIELSLLLAELSRSIGCTSHELTKFVFHTIEGIDNYVFGNQLWSDSDQVSAINRYLVEDEALQSGLC
eukprot:m51a1_g4951 hypothetical protein (254) ;mRNA; f:336812-337878